MRYTKKTFENYKKIISKLEKKELILVSVFLCLVIFGFGYWFGVANFDPGNNNVNINNVEKGKIAIPLIGGLVVTGLFSIFINDYVLANIEKYDNQVNIRKATDDNARLNQLRENQDLDFFSNLSSNELKRIKYKYIKQNGSHNDLQRRIKEYSNNNSARQQALEGIEKGFNKDLKKIAPFEILIREACNYAVDISRKEKPEELNEFYKDIKIYLKVWLFSSLKFGVATPVILPILNYEIKLKSQGKSINLDVEIYIKAIEFIQNEALNDPAIEEFFSTTEAKKIVKDYLYKLILILKQSTLNTTNREDDFEESTEIM